MGIYIPNMEMPKDCSYCKMAYDGSWCLLSEESNDCVEGGMMWRKCPYGGRPSWCPLVPLQEGHGELIDKQAFIADIDGFIECMTSVGAVVDGELLWGKLLDALANAKTIVPAEGGTKYGN